MKTIILGLSFLSSISAFSSVDLPLECSYESGNDAFQNVSIVMENTSDSSVVKVTDIDANETNYYNVEASSEESLTIKSGSDMYVSQYVVNSDSATFSMLGGQVSVTYKCEEL